MGHCSQPGRGPSWKERQVGVNCRKIFEHWAITTKIEWPRRANGYPSLQPDPIEPVAKTEHARWRAEKYLAGWNPGTETDRANRSTNVLSMIKDEFGKLYPDEQTKDRQQIEGLPSTLMAIGYGIYR